MAQDPPSTSQPSPSRGGIKPLNNTSSITAVATPVFQRLCSENKTLQASQVPQFLEETGIRPPGGVDPGGWAQDAVAAVAGPRVKELSYDEWCVILLVLGVVQTGYWKRAESWRHDRALASRPACMGVLAYMRPLSLYLQHGHCGHPAEPTGRQPVPGIPSQFSQHYSSRGCESAPQSPHEEQGLPVHRWGKEMRGAADGASAHSSACSCLS